MTAPTSTNNIAVSLPQGITESSPYAQLYKAAFQEVFDFIKKTSEYSSLDDSKKTECQGKANAYAQAIFRAKMFGDTDYSGKFCELTRHLQLNETQRTELIKTATTAGEKLDALKSTLESFDIQFLTPLNKLPEDQQAGYVSMFANLADILPGIPNHTPNSELNLEQSLERKNGITEAVFETFKELQTSLELNPKLNIREFLAKNLTEKLTKANLKGLTQEELTQMLATIKNHLGSKEKMQEGVKSTNEFLKQYGQWLVMLLPFLAAPLTKAVSYIPIIGSSLAELLGQAANQAPHIITNFLLVSQRGEKPERQSPPATTGRKTRTPITSSQNSCSVI
jgi:hypothetical protein